MLTGFKGFDENLQCRGFQYAIGQTYETDATPIRCTENGFHFCEFPLDVFAYYPPATSRYCVVEGDGQIDRTNGNDSKVAVSRLSINREMPIHEVVQAGVNYILSHVRDADKAAEQADCSAATNTGHWSAATNTGSRSAATDTGNRSAATNTGNYSAASVEGKESVAMAIGYQNKAKGALGCWLVLAEWDMGAEHIQDVQCARVDGEAIKADTWYQLKNGQFVAQTAN